MPSYLCNEGILFRIVTKSILDKFQNKYRIPSARASWWDYGSQGAYFITICTQDRWHYFGEIIEGKMQYSQVGVLADIFWLEIPFHAQKVTLGEYIVMPNHIHGILILEDSFPTVPPKHSKSNNFAQNRFQNPGKNSISSIVGSYKSAVSKHARRLGFEFAWQSRFYDHIIRNAEEYQRIENYIINNPHQWEKDKFFGK